MAASVDAAGVVNLWKVPSVASLLADEVAAFQAAAEPYAALNRCERRAELRTDHTLPLGPCLRRAAVQSCASYPSVP